jgi:hypothetical protein
MGPRRVLPLLWGAVACVALQPGGPAWAQRDAVWEGSGFVADPILRPPWLSPAGAEIHAPLGVPALDADGAETRCRSTPSRSRDQRGATPRWAPVDCTPAASEDMAPGSAISSISKESIR